MKPDPQNSLLELKRCLTEASAQEEKIRQLSGDLEVANERRARAVDAAQELLEGFVSTQHELFTNLGELMAQAGVRVAGKTAPPAPSSTPKKAKAKKKKKTVRKPPKKAKKQKVVNRSTETGRVMPVRTKKALGYPSKLDESIKLSAHAAAFVEVLRQRWPLFTTPDYFVRKGMLPATNHITAKVNGLRKKGIPIESARQARESDPSIASTERGYRLIS